MPERLHIHTYFFTPSAAVNTFLGRAKGAVVILKIRMQFSLSAKLLIQTVFFTKGMKTDSAFN
jgi:hypothetical protein